MTEELERLIDKIHNKKIQSILKSGEESPLQKTFIDPALETLAREVLNLEEELRRLG